ncbi:hypothetical protein FB561_5841 [Kribbella amoyensis]|uniref:Uncharacterized protein n=1 Tax=Kribbella amoyensis TaxID=996641 RepID=A0A561C0S2_9ACTN|nr:DUF6463 family protein [Kribbella amoyensis]TWD84647.1 hypothetical protein FB561_5841 [Kribbella amoyensis]
MITWAGWLITAFGTLHTLGALTVEKAATHADVWFARGLWDEGFQSMSPAMSAYWFSVDSFGIPLALLGLVVVWMGRRGIVPPTFLVWGLGAWWALDAYILSVYWNAIIPVLAILFLALGIRRARSQRRADEPAPA